MPELPGGTRLGAIRLRVHDVETMRSFYENTIGLRVLGTDDGVTALGTDDHALIELLADPTAPSRQPRSTGLFHLALLTPTRGDLARALRRVIESGWRLSGASDHLVSEALYLSDPEGNGIELYRDRPRDDWLIVEDNLQMATLPLDLNDLLAEPLPTAPDHASSADAESAAADPASRQPFGMAPATRLGHVHLQVADLQEAEAFWVGALGFDVIVRGYPGALFVSAGGYHHHVGLNTWAGVGAPRPPENARGLVRFEVVLPDKDDVRDAADRLAAVASVENTDGGVLAVDPSGNRVLVRPGTTPSQLV
jgi:catechol 2,3-dioxygenase